jgi:hypothetical protein
MDLRVASNFASFGATGAGASGRPAASLFQLRLPMRLRVAPRPASSGSAGDGSSSCLESRILQRPRRLSFGLPSAQALPVAPADEVPGCPGSCIFRRCRRWIFESPRISHPSAPPAFKLRVAPRLKLFQLRLPMRFQVALVPASSGFAGDESSSCPESRILRRSRRFKLRVAPRLSSPVAPPGVVASCPAPCTFRLCLGFESSGCPVSSLPWRRLMVHRVASVPAPSGFAVPASSGCPESCTYGLGR